MVRLVAAFLLAAQIASAQVYVRTNDVLNLDPLSEAMQAQIGQQFRLRYVVTQGGVVQDITGYRITFEMIDVRDSIVSQTGTVQILDAPAGDVSVRFNVSGPTLQIGQTYQGVSKAYIGSNYVGMLSDDYISIVEAYCPTCTVTGGGGGGGSTSVTVTNLNTSSVIVTNLIVSTNIISVTVTNTSGGGGGSGTLSGFNSATTGGVFLVVSNGWDASITNEGNVFTITTGLPQGATGVNQVATWNGTNWIATALGAPTPTPTVGTNVVKWTTVWGTTNTWVAPSTQILFTAWGAGGGAGGSGAGFAKALWVGSAGTVFDIVIGTGGGYSATNNGPFAGSGILGATTNSINGGGATYIAISGTTNIILMAGGSGGGSSSGASGFGGPGGGYWFESLDGTRSGTNVQAGQGGWASNEYGLAATAGTNLSASITNLMQNGGYLRGGHASTNGCTSGTFGALGGGGGGWYGGAGGTRTNATSGMAANTGAGGGGGLGYANTNYVTFAQLIAGERSVAGSPSGQDQPTYTSGRGVGGSANGAGANGCAGAMW